MNSKMINKNGQFNFVWLFAIVAGGAILFLAIFGAMKTGDTARLQSDTEAGKSISIITDPLQAGFSEASFGRISFRQDTRINNICFSEEFGKNEISVATRSEIGEEWNLAGAATSVHNKYIFSSEKTSGKDFYIFSKPFSFPYKVADLIFLIPDNYCFIGASPEISDEIIGLNIPNIEIETDIDNCTLLDSIVVCFGDNGGDCDMGVYAERVEKDGEDIYYVGNLMYAAIFSDKSVYDCNVKRLMYRASKLAEEFSEKADLMNARGCSTSMGVHLTSWSDRLTDIEYLDDSSLISMMEELGDRNDGESCEIWK